MNNYETTALWQKTLGIQGDTNVDRLRVAYQTLRDHMKGLLDEVRRDFPNLTVHSIEHVDDLWRIASMITGAEYPINPLEGFIMGYSFLVHDSVLSYKAFGGKDALRATVEWKDNYQDIARTQYDTEEGKQKIDFKVIRQLHAKSCEEILSQQFEGLDGKRNYLMSDDEMRTNYGGLIGQIAASHHWETSQLLEFPVQVNALAVFPSVWTIHPLKLACILRCADAAAIDAGRAPDCLFRLLQLNGVSKDHWMAQNRLAIGLDSADDSRLMITSTRDFEEKDFSAWNVAFDAAKVVDTELEKCQELLPLQDRFKVKTVAGAKARKALSAYIRTKGWTPSDVNVHISDVAKLIKTLGGKELYGKEDHHLTVLRELIQNARDAIKARRLLEGEDNFNGKIVIKVCHTDKGTELTVTDDGVGMSLETISRSLLNFGNSFWHEDAVNVEFPGLKAAGYQPVGQYGIGFFSVFMIAKSVVVDTRKFRDGLDNAHLVKFPSGLTLAPIFAKHTSATTAYSTRISLVLDDEHQNWPTEYEAKRSMMNATDFKVPMFAMMGTLVAGLDVDVYYQEFEGAQTMIHQRIDTPTLDKKAWLRALSLADYQKDKALDDYIEANYNRLQFIYDDNGRFAGLAAIGNRFLPFQDFLGGATVGGLLTALHSRTSEYWIGILEKHPGGAKRNGDKFTATETRLRDWVNEQVANLGKPAMADITMRYRLQLAMQFFKTDPKRIAVAFCMSGAGGHPQIAGSLDMIVQMIAKGQKLVFLDSDFSSKKDNEGHGDSYMDASRVVTLLKPDEWLYMPLMNSAFLTYKLEDGVPKKDFGFIDCFYRVADDLGFKVEYSYRENFAKNNFGMEERALVMELKKKS